ARLHLEVGERLAVAGAGDALFEQGAVLRHARRHEAHREEAVAQLAGQLHVRLAAAAEPDWEARVGVQDGLQRLTEAQRAGAGIRQRDLAPLVGHGLFALEDLAHDRDVVAQLPVRLAPRLPVPALDDLRPRYPEARDGPPAAGQRIQGPRRHRGRGGPAPG